MINAFEEMLTGGHPNSLGKTEEVTELVLADKAQLEDLWDCYESEDEVVRLRVSSALKRIAKAQPKWIHNKFDDFVKLSDNLKQPSFQWSFAQIMLWIDELLDDNQRKKVIEILKNILQNTDDWIVLNMTMETLTSYAKKDAESKAWLLPHLERLLKDKRQSVAKRARTYIEELS